ncbi:hypothetical protein DdX_11780 [Ditylenchus destructor]|uniref:Uncharacterized protein n=1 Tax=Ditylenchus destructor TaxID=166010 RepID=A0AAD4QY01_9BILA|nr:hypothetical protein DdX_11780 [Ditylenchus destructor]
MQPQLFLTLIIAISIPSLFQSHETHRNIVELSSGSSSEEQTNPETNDLGDRVQLRRPLETEPGPEEELRLAEEMKFKVLSRRKRFLCNKFTGDQLCFMPPFSLRCRCGVSGCFMGKCMCNQCGHLQGYGNYPPYRRYYD